LRAATILPSYRQRPTLRKPTAESGELKPCGEAALCSSQNLSIEILDDLPKGAQLIGTGTRKDSSASRRPARPHTLWDRSWPAWACRFLDERCHQTISSRIDPMKKIAGSLRKLQELNLSYLRPQKLISNGVVEGVNKARVALKSPRFSHGAGARTGSWQFA